MKAIFVRKGWWRTS
ncbi:TPA: trp operon leader peptide [Escherichia coli]|nr:trp operon leader peptide [Escherichia coli O22:H8]ELO0451085.1 trp operon leader peptide [Escherichia coli O55]HBL0969305.1 trp operon leader peptide [Escherichia coli]